MAFHVHADSEVDGLVAHRAAVTHFNVNAVEIQNRIERIEGPDLPDFHILAHGVGDSRYQAWRHLGPIDLLQVALNLPDRQAARVQRDDLVVEAGPTGLMFVDDLRRKRALPITRDIQRQRAEIAFV